MSSDKQALSKIFPLLFLASGLSLLAAPVPQHVDAQHMARCTDYVNQQTYAMKNDQWERLVTIARLEMTECADLMGLKGQAGSLTMIATGLNGLGRFDDALPISKRCVSIKPDETSCYVEMGRSYEGLGSLQEALDAYRKAIDIGGYDSQAAVGVSVAKIRAAQIEALIAAITNAENSKKQPAPEAITRFEGTGFFVTDKGDILTNNHVVSGCSQLHTRDGALLRLVGTDPESDLALLKSSLVPPAVATFRLGAPPRLGDQVITFGFPLTGLLSSGGNLSVGIVTGNSGIGDDPRVFQISAPVQPGNSGGPLLDDSGNVVGVVVAKLDAVKIAKATGDIPQNVNFAIRSSEIFRFLDANSIRKRISVTAALMKTPDIAKLAQQITVQIECIAGGDGKENQPASELDSALMAGILGKPVFDPSVQEFLKNLNGGENPNATVIDVDPTGVEHRVYIFPNIGVGVDFRNGRAGEITLHGQAQADLPPGEYTLTHFEPFRGIMPLGLSWKQNRSTNLSRLGPPQFSQHSQQDPNTVGFHMWDEYRKGDFQYTLDYNKSGELLWISIELR